MKKVLLTLIVTMLTCLGAWAEPTSWGTDNKGSWEVDGTTLTVTFASQADWNGLGWGSEPWASSESGLTTVVLKFADDFDATAQASQDNFYHFTQKIGTVTTLDLSALTAEFFTENVKNDLTANKHYSGNGNGQVSTIVLPNSYEYDSSQDPWKNYTIQGGINTGGSGNDTPGGEEGPGDDPKGREVIFNPADDDVNVAIGTPYQFNMSTTGYTGNNMSVATCTVTKDGEVCDATVFEVRYAGGQALANVRHSQITTILDPKSVGDYVVTFYLSDYDATWNKDGAAVTKSITVHAYDPTIATSFTVSPTSPTVDMGDKTTVNVNLFPATAGLTKSDVTIVSGLGTKVNDAEDILKVTIADDKSSVEIDATNAASTGTATFTLTPNGLDPVTVTVTVVNPRVKATASCPASVRMGETSLSASVTLGDDLNADDYTISYSSDAESILKVDATSGVLTPVSVGTANITVTVAPKDEDAALDPFTQTFAVEVKKGELALALSASPAALPGGQTGSSTISHTVTLNGEPTTSGYTISAYELVGEVPTGVTLEDGVVSVPATVTTGEIKVQATITPTDAAAYECTTATAEAVIKVVNSGVVLSKETIDGKEFVVVNVINGGDFGTTLSDNPAVINAGASLADLKNAANIKVEGLLKNSDVQELVNLIGVTTMGDGYCKILDMGDATMTEAITNEGYKCSLVSTANYKSLVSVETLVLPNPAIGVDGGTILPKGMSGLHGLWNNVSDNHLMSLTIPEGWTEVASEAWASANTDPTLGGTAISLQNLTTLNLPNSIEKVGDWAFSGLGVKALFMPKEIAYIGAAAFSNSPNMSDIYFTGDGSKLKYVDQDAFSHQTQMVNNCINNDNICNNKHMPTMDRSHYVNGGVLACILHYPEGCDAEYTDVTRKYKVVDTSVASGITYGKGNENSSYIPEGWTAEFKTAVNAASKNEDIMVITANPLMVSGGFPDEVYGYSLIWPSQYQMTSGYAIANAGYLWNGTKMTSEQLDYTDPDNPVDKRGLYQFIVAMGNAPKDKEEWTFDYELDKWYTIALPFDMSPAQIRDVFGPNTQVCRFSGVQRVAEGEDKKIVLEFRNSVMKEGDGRAEDNTYSVVKYENDKPAGTMSMTYEEGGIQHHWPYMIKPGGKAEGQLAMKFKNYNAIPGILNQDKVNSTSSVSSEQPKQYAFCPILTKQYYDGEVNDGGGFKKNSYVFVDKINGTSVPHQYVFFKGIKDGKGGYRDGGTVNAFTAYVQLAHGQNECETFFGGSDYSAPHLAPIYASLFGDDEEVNGIEKVVIACGTDSIDNDKIYTINGVLVNGTHLPAGLYIKNGKKFIVK